MKIGIDIDGVILDSEREFRIQAELYDIIKLNKNSIVNNKELKAQERYSWNKEEITGFVNEHFLKVSRECNFMPGAIEIINMLKQEGNELIIITARGGIIKEMQHVAEERFAEKNISEKITDLSRCSHTCTYFCILYPLYGKRKERL